MPFAENPQSDRGANGFQRKHQGHQGGRNPRSGVVEQEVAERQVEHAKCRQIGPVLALRLPAWLQPYREHHEYHGGESQAVQQRKFQRHHMALNLDGNKVQAPWQHAEQVHQYIQIDCPSMANAPVKGTQCRVSMTRALGGLRID
jgi:hypothetical protein